MNKLEMAHQFAIARVNSGVGFMTSEIVEDSWKYADAMQAEADKRNNKETCDKDIGLDSSVLKPSNSMELEWQPDWSQAPDWAVAWAMDMSGECYWHSGSKEPKVYNHIFESSADGHTFEAPSFSYQGNWKDSLRKRPNT